MRKLICVFFVIVMLLPLSACKGEETVTIYIPETMTSISKIDTVSDVYDYLFEEGWQEKTSFTVTMRSSIGDFLGQDAGVTMQYGDKCFVSDYGQSVVTDRLDESGKVISRVTEYSENHTDIHKSEVSYTYDAQGRTLTIHSVTYYTDRDKPFTQSYTYTYRDTDQGSEGVATIGKMTETMVYNKEGLLIEMYQKEGEEILCRFTYVYDAHGNKIGGETYVKGERMTKTVTTFKAVEVSKETANRLPCFKRGN